MDSKNPLEEGIENMLRTEQSTTFAINPRIQHGILGIADEAGELVKVVKACVYYHAKLDHINLMEELGDIWWYYCLIVDELAKIADSDCNQILFEIIAMNKAKLQARYPNKFTEDLANSRNTDVEREAMEEVIDE